MSSSLSTPETPLSGADPTRVIRALQAGPDYRGQVVHIEHLPPREPVYGELEQPLVEPVVRALQRAGIAGFYSHQAEAINAARRGESVVIATSTASGKSLCYHIPVLEALFQDHSARALYLFPTKALAQDQLRSLREMLGPDFDRLGIGTFDGDTPPAERSKIKRSARLVLTNPDMLHLGILPNHGSWAPLLRNLRFLVIDEAHVYRGVFGSHVANVFRRLRRLCARYGSSPQVIAASATIANPAEHLGRLVGQPFRVVDSDGSPHGPKDFVLWNPPVIDRYFGTRRSANVEASWLFAELVRHGVRTIVFARTRRLAELICVYARDYLSRHAPELAGRVATYRAGYLPEERRRLERALFGGDLLGVAATTALELGVDIGDLGATILTGYPGSIASTWQQAGRSGRGTGPSLSILVAYDDPLDQYFMREPQALFGRPHESALINPDNPYILGPHLLCAAYELPIRDDEDFFGPAARPLLAELTERGLLRWRNGHFYPAATVGYPAEHVDIRSTSEADYEVVDLSRGGALLETVDGTVAFFQIHPGAVYLHQGETYIIEDLDLAGRRAYARPAEVNYYTQVKDLTSIRLVRPLRTQAFGPVEVGLGEVDVTTLVVGYRKKRQFTEEVIGEEPLDLPPQTIRTVAVWWTVPEGLERECLRLGLDFAGGLHAAEHAAIGLLPLFALCDRRDIGGLSTPAHPDVGHRPAIFIYDGHAGGVGIAEKAYETLESLWAATLKVVRECECQDGCPACIQSPKCGNNNQPLDKRAAVVILEGLLAAVRV